ncbi:hypothetical protein C4573_02155 [Candidatus Woesearchaeota archaeon]|nr:MAG: hypothetical protein C4573_02155 [Candidatus Woesearchaeota archaeon]
MLKVYKLLYNQRVFTLTDVKAITKNYQVAKNTIQRLLAKNYIKRIHKGLYHIVPFGDEQYVPDPILVASRLRKKYYFSLVTALQIHDLAESQNIYIASDVNKKLRIYNRDYYIYKTKSFFGVEERVIGNQKVKVSDMERTFLDCLLHLELLGGLDNFLAIGKDATVNQSKLVDYIKNYRLKKLYSLAGYALEQLQADEKTLEKLEKKLGKKVYYIEKKSRYAQLVDRFKKPKLIKRWNLIG